MISSFRIFPELEYKRRRQNPCEAYGMRSNYHFRMYLMLSKGKYAIILIPFLCIQCKKKKLENN